MMLGTKYTKTRLTGAPKAAGPIIWRRPVVRSTLV